jgi:hypothetical protein
LARINYSYIKYQKELAAKKKKEAKQQMKLEKKMQAKGHLEGTDGTAASAPDPEQLADKDLSAL